MDKRLSPRLAATATLGVLVGGALLAAPAASADGPAGTVATFSLAGATTAITMSVPTGTDSTPVSLGGGTAGDASVTGTLGAVQVTDNRAKLLTTWTVGVTSTSFDLVGGSASVATQTVPATNIVYATGTPTLTGPGTGTFTPLAATALSAAQTAGAYTGSGSRTVSWSPTLVFALSPGQIAGTYKGTITHSLTTVS